MGDSEHSLQSRRCLLCLPQSLAESLRPTHINLRPHCFFFGGGVLPRDTGILLQSLGFYSLYKTALGTSRRRPF